MRHLSTKNLSFNSPTGRCLVSGLNMRIEREHVAVVGRNGVGKSTLLEVLAGQIVPSKGRVERFGSIEVVRQSLDAANSTGLSPGELRRTHLSNAFAQRPAFLLLDEPSQELDREGTNWLSEKLRSHSGALVVVTHDRQLLRLFDAFFIVAESGCCLITGGFETLMQRLEAKRVDANHRYVAELTHLVKKEEHNAKIRRRRTRKRAGGRVRELGRCPSRANLNAKRGYAQVYQGKREGVREDRIAAARDWAKAARRALTIDLPLVLPQLHPCSRSQEPVIAMSGVHSTRSGTVKFPMSELALTHERLAVVGPNGSGKSSLLQVLMGDLRPDDGLVRVDWRRVGYIAQHAANWELETNLVSLLLARSDATCATEVATRLAAHKFPLALAERPLRSLSPGERTRAALLGLFHKSPQIEMLVLDEPTVQLDLLGLASLEEALTAWEGGLLVVSHDEEFLARLNIIRRISLS